MAYTYSILLQDVQDISAPLYSKPRAAVHALYAFSIQWNLKMQQHNPLFITQDG